MHRSAALVLLLAAHACAPAIRPTEPGPIEPKRLSEFWEETILPLLKVFWEWATTPLGAAVTATIIGVILILRWLLKR